MGVAWLVIISLVLGILASHAIWALSWALYQLGMILGMSTLIFFILWALTREAP